MIMIKEEKNCVGCTACYNICTKNAIRMQPDKNGYVYPIVTKELCVDCGLCEEVCPILQFKADKNTSNKGCFAAWNNDEKVRGLSTSGGVFSVLADYFFENNGYVVGAKFGENNKIEHIILDSSESLYQLRKAKYVQSDLSDIFQKVKDLLESNNNVLFSGTPCQISGLKTFLRNDYSNLFTVDIICYGVSSQKIFDSYVKSLENTNGSNLVSFDFRNKSSGWERYSTKAEFDNGYISYISKYDDCYIKGYLDYSLYIRPSCTDCVFKGENRSSDITLGDFWGVEKILTCINSVNGVSSVVINTEKGKEIFNNILDKLKFIEVNLSDIISENQSYSYSTPLGKYSEYFFKYFEKVDFIELINKIEKKALWDRKDLSLKERLYLIKERIKGN